MALLALLSAYLLWKRGKQPLFVYYTAAYWLPRWRRASGANGATHGRHEAARLGLVASVIAQIRR